MKRQVALVLMAALYFSTGALQSAPEPEVGNSCLLNAPPNCTFDPVCTADCDVLYPRAADPDANCECKLGCCMPLD